MGIKGAHMTAREYLWRKYYNTLIVQRQYPRFVYKFLPINAYSLSALIRHSLWFSSLDDYNDPYEGEFYLHDKIKEFARNEYNLHDQDLDQFEEEYLAVFKTIQEDKIVCCFSKRPNNILLWSHYGKSHTGICLEFDPLLDADLFLTLTPITYQIKFEPLDVWDKPQDLITHLFFRKATDWKYEKEYRVLRIGKPALIKYEPTSLRSIIFGAKAKEEDIETIRLILRDSVSYKQAHLNKKSFKLIINKLEI